MDKDPFQAAIEQLCEELGRRCEGLMQHLDEARRTQRTVADDLRELGARFDVLANLYVQIGQLHSSLRLRDVVTAINDVLTNLIGSEDFALLVRDGDGDRFAPLWAVGAGARVGGFALDEGPLGEAARGRAIRYRERPDEPVATVPLPAELRAGCVGVVVVCGLVGHKKALAERDRVLLEAFAPHAAVALEAAMYAAAAERALPAARLRELCGDLPPPPTLSLDGEKAS